MARKQSERAAQEMAEVEQWEKMSDVDEAERNKSKVIEPGDERVTVCANIGAMPTSSWSGLRELLRQHGFGSLFIQSK